MSEVLDRIREKYPQYKDVGDVDLVHAIGNKYPVYLDQDPEFSDEFATAVDRRAQDAAKGIRDATTKPQEPAYSPPPIGTALDPTGPLSTTAGAPQGQPGKRLPVEKATPGDVVAAVQNVLEKGGTSFLRSVRDLFTGQSLIPGAGQEEPPFVITPGEIRPQTRSEADPIQPGRSVLGKFHPTNLQPEPNAFEGLLQGMTTPGGIVALPVAGAGIPGVSRAALGYFGAQGVQSIYEAGKTLNDPKATPEQKRQAVEALPMDLLMVLGGIKSVLPARPKSPLEAKADQVATDGAPATAEALRGVAVLPTGKELKMPGMVQPPIGESTTTSPELVSSEQAAAQAKAMQLEATAAYEPSPTQPAAPVAAKPKETDASQVEKQAAGAIPAEQGQPPVGQAEGQVEAGVAQPQGPGAEVVAKPPPVASGEAPGIQAPLAASVSSAVTGAGEAVPEPPAISKATSGEGSAQAGLPEAPSSPVPAPPVEPVSPEQAYDKSLEEFRSASRKFNQSQSDYRSKKIGDAEFLAARAEFDKASKEADQAETAFIEAKNAVPPAAKPPAPPPVVKESLPTEPSAKPTPATAEGGKGDPIAKIDDELKAPYSTDAIRGELNRRKAAILQARKLGRRYSAYQHSTYGSNRWGIVDAQTGHKVEGPEMEIDHPDLGRTRISGPISWKTKREAELVISELNKQTTASSPAAPAESPAAPSSKAKEPWEMTRAEIVERDKQLWGDQSTEQGQHAMLTAHRKHVIDALREGKPVPPEVLADYPDLQAKATPTAPPAPQAAEMGASVGLSAEERVELNELRTVREERGKLGVLNTSRLADLEAKDSGVPITERPEPPSPDLDQKIADAAAAVDVADRATEQPWKDYQKAEAEEKKADRSYGQPEKLEKARAKTAKKKAAWLKADEAKTASQRTQWKLEERKQWDTAEPFNQWVWRMRAAWEKMEPGKARDEFKRTIMDAIDDEWDRQTEALMGSMETAKRATSQVQTLNMGVFSGPLDKSNQMSRMASSAKRIYEQRQAKRAADEEIGKMTLNYGDLPSIQEYDSVEIIRGKLEKARAKSKENVSERKAAEKRQEAEVAKEREAELDKARKLQSEGKLGWKQVGTDADKRWVPVEAKRVKLAADPEAKAFVSRNEYAKTSEQRWSVTEESTGFSLGFGKTQGEAVASANANIEKFGLPKFREKVAESAKGLPPKPDITESTPPTPAKATKPKPEAPAAETTGTLTPAEAEPPKGPEIQGMGGAIPSEYELSPKTPTSIKNATVEQERAKRGLPPAVEPARRSFGRVWDEAMAAIDRDPGSSSVPGIQDSLIKELRHKPRAITDFEDALLLHRQIDLQNEYGKATRDLAQAFDDGRMDDVDREKLRTAAISDALLDLYDIDKSVGTATSRGLNARKMMANEDFTLASLETQKRSALGGRELTDPERARLEKVATDYAEANAKLQQAVAEREQRITDLLTKQAMDDAKRAAEAEKAPSSAVVRMAERIVQTLDSKADAARARIKARMSRTSAGVDPTVLLDLAEIGASHIAHVGLDFAKWSERMLGELGDLLTKEQLPEVWKASQAALDRVADQISGKDQAEPALRHIKGQTPEQAIEGFAKAIADRIENGQPNRVQNYLQRLARILYSRGITEREAMVTKLTEILQEKMPEVTRQEVARMWSGYGDYKPLSKDQITVALRGMKGELQQIAKLEDMAEGRSPLKSGVQRREQTEAERKLVKLVNDAKYKFQIPIEDPERQLKSALDTLKTTYRNRITDLEERIKNRDYEPRPRREIILDTEATRLKANVERVKKKWREELLADRLKNRTPWEKFFDLSTKFRRFGVLTSPVVIPKLLSAGAQRLASLPLEDLARSGLRQLPGISRIADRAPLEGQGENVAATLRGFAASAARARKAAWDVLKTGHSEIDVLYGKAGESYTGESELMSKVLSFPGRFHGFLKAPIKQAMFDRAVQRLGEFYTRQGLDPMDEVVQARIYTEAYKAANRSIFLNDNWVASKVSTAIREHMPAGEKHATVGGKLWSTAGRFALPIVRVPTNIVAETMQYIGGSISGGSRLLALALKGGVENLKPEQADLIMRELTKGSVGAAVMFIGYLNADKIGGFYDPSRKKEKGAVKWGSINVMGHNVPSFLLHNPLLETLQFAATIRHVADSKLRKKDQQPQGHAAALEAAAFGLIEEVPFVREMAEIEKYRNPYTREGWKGEQLKSVLIPSVVSKVAEWTDRNRKRVPKTIGEHLKTGIPGLRQTVKEKPVPWYESK